MNYICAVWNKPGRCWELTYGASKSLGAGERSHTLKAQENRNMYIINKFDENKTNRQTSAKFMDTLKSCYLSRDPKSVKAFFLLLLFECCRQGNETVVC